MDVSIAGAGLVGRVLALCLAEATDGALSVELTDAAPGPVGHGDMRAYALTPGARRMLERIGVWDDVAPETQPAWSMSITDSHAEEIIRPVLLEFGQPGGEEPVAHFLEARVLVRAVEAACDRRGIVPVFGRRTRGLDRDAATVRGLPDGSPARLMVGADGARSAVRRAAGIGSVGWPYRQTGIVAVLRTEVAHDGIAVQHFLPGGPFALLPLPGGRTGLVWTLPERRAEALVKLSPAALREEIEAAAGPEVGAIEIVEGPVAFPLSLMLSRRYVAERVALVGDAAHRLHPLAGLGLNVGLRDAAALAEVLVEAARRGEDIGSLGVLERYERWRRPDAVAIAFATEGLNRLFAARSGPMRTLRDAGLRLVDGSHRLKERFTADADGQVVPPPRLFQGLAI